MAIRNNKNDYYDFMLRNCARPHAGVRMEVRNALSPSVTKITAAGLLSAHYGVDVIFAESHRGIKAPDVRLFDTYWKIRSPIGAGVRTVKRQIQRALPCSASVILDARRLRLDRDEVRAEVRQIARTYTGQIRHLILIERDGNIVEVA